MSAPVDVLAERLLRGVQNIAAQSGGSVEVLVEYFYDKGGMSEGLFAIAELRDRKSHDAAVAELIEAARWYAPNANQNRSGSAWIAANARLCAALARCQP